MAEGSLVVDGKIKFREGKKWKPRWCILKKPSPVADILQVLLYKDVTEARKVEAKPKGTFSLDGFFGLHSGFSFDREPFVMAILCQKSISLMAFDYRDDMIQFEIKIRQSLGEEHQFPVKVVKSPTACRLPKEQVLVMIHDHRMCLVALTPPKLLLAWNVEDLRRFGAQNGRFCFEGGDKCGKGSGVFAFQSEQAEDIADIVHLASTGKTSNCHRKFKNRSSQIDFASRLIADLSSSSSTFTNHTNSNMRSRSPVQGALPVNLNCCHDNQTNSADSEDWSWYKRHSVSVMDHRRIAALRESRHVENRDQFPSGVYDIPPNNSPAVENSNNNLGGEPLYDSPRSNLSALTPTGRQTEDVSEGDTVDMSGGGDTVDVSGEGDTVDVSGGGDTVDVSGGGDRRLTIVPVDIPFSYLNETEFGTGIDTNDSALASGHHIACEVSRVDSLYQCVSPAKTVLRPRAGREYAVIQRRPLSSAFFGISDAVRASPCENRIFNFEFIPPAASSKSFNQNGPQTEARPFHLETRDKAEGAVYSSLSQSMCFAEATPQRSPNDPTISKSLVSLPEKSAGSEAMPTKPGSSLRVNPAHTHHYVLSNPSPRTTHLVSPAHQKHKDNSQDLFFFPINEPQSAAHSPSPYCKSSQKVSSPIYVNQEFIDKHHSNVSRNTAVVSGASHVSASPIRSLMSLFFKDSSSKHNSHMEPQSVLYRRSSTRSGLSESEAIKIEKKPFKINHSRSLTLPHSKVNACLSLPGGLHSSHKEVGFKERMRQERSTPEASHSRARLNGRDYSNFAESSIIARRRQAQSEARLVEPNQRRLGQKHPTKTSGYKNIDRFGAPLQISVGSTSNNTDSLSQPYRASESHPDLHHEQTNHVTERLEPCHGNTTVMTPVVLPPTPPPPLPVRRPASPPTSFGHERTPSDISTDSAPSYFAPSPPSSPGMSGLPPLPPRMFPPPSRCVHTPSPRTPLELHHPASPNSSDDLSQQELNYIMVDMTDAGKPPPPPPEPSTPPVAYRRRSKRAKQQKLEDTGKSSYALIDFTVTKALERAGQEHRVDSLRRASGQLNRMNSVPSSARKPLSLVHRERTLSSTSIESC